MAKLGFTIQQVEGFAATGKLQRIRVPDSPGLYLQVAAKPGKSGVPTKTWIFRYIPTEGEFRAHRRKPKPHEMFVTKGQVWLTLGKYPQMSISKAEAEAAKLRDARRLGKDLRELIRPEPPPPPPTPVAKKTVNDLLDLFEQTMAELRESTRKEYIRMLRTKVREWIDAEGRVFGDRPAVDVTGIDAAALLKACRESAPRTSTIVAIKMTQCWEYGMTLGILPDARNLWKGQVRPKIRKKDRHLTESELVKVGKRLDSCGEPEDCVIGYKLYLLTGMRHRNLAHARWDWVDLEHRRISVPREQHKTGGRTDKPLTVYLSTHAVTLLKRLKAIRDSDEETKESPWLYPKNGEKTGHRDDLGDPWERIRKGQSWSDVNIHDLRRTLASLLSTLGYKGYAGEVLGHAGTSVTDIYTHTAPAKLLAMLDEAGDRIVGLLEGRMLPNRNGKLAPEAGPAKGTSQGGEPPVGAKAARMHNEQGKTDLLKPKAVLFSRKRT